MTLTMADLSQRYQKIIEMDFPANTTDAAKALNYMENSTGFYHGEAIEFLYMPKLYTAKALLFLEEVGKTTYQILGRIITEYRQNPKYRQLFNFPKELENWLTLPSQYESTLPIARIDLFFNEDDFSFTFCEFNADGASAMNKDREIYNALKNTKAFKDMSNDYNLNSFELFNSWVKAFMEIYSTTEKAVEKPFIAIADFLESGTSEEFKVFQSAFTSQGFETEICEIRDLRYENNSLFTAAGRKIDAIYRRAVTGEMFQKRSEIPDFLAAVANNDVVIIGALYTQIIHNKILFAIIHQEETLGFLTPAQRDFVKAHFPFTVKLTKDNNLEDIIKNKNQWLIKPEDLYGSRGVYAGIDETEGQWSNLVKEYTNKGYLAQHYCPPYVTKNLDFNQNSEWQEYNNITGLYLYNGEVKGIYSRAGKAGVISSLHEGRTMTSILATSKGEASSHQK